VKQGFAKKIAQEIGIQENWGEWKLKSSALKNELYFLNPNTGTIENTAPDEYWVNKKFSVSIHTYNYKQGEGKKILISRNDGSKNVLWADKQRIKNELVGSDRFAIECFPLESNLIDFGNVYWLYVMPEGVTHFD
jgi:hypothetical protein